MIYKKLDRKADTRVRQFHTFTDGLMMSNREYIVLETFSRFVSLLQSRSVGALRDRDGRLRELKNEMLNQLEKTYS